MAFPSTFTFTPNWADAVARQITYDLRETDLGFGAEYFTPLASYTVNAWDFSILLESASDLVNFESFNDALYGRLKPFYLPTPMDAMEFFAGVSTTQFDIVGEDLSSSWNTRPDTRLFITLHTGTQVSATIQSVTDNGDGTERVTLTAALPTVPAEGTTIQRLHFVRWANDVEEMDFLAENVARVKLTAVELPTEYGQIVSGERPCYLYDIYADAPVNLHWRYTSFASAVACNGQLYQPWAMSHEAIALGTDGQDNPVNVSAKPDGSHPFSLLAGVPPGRVIWLDIYRVDATNLAAPVKLFSGYISTVTDDGLKYTAKCLSRLAWLQTKLPRFYIGSDCNHILFEPNTCRAARALFETTVTHYADVAGNLPEIQVTFDFAFDLPHWTTTGWWDGGIIEAGVGTTYEIRSITASHFDGTRLWLALNAKFNHVTPGTKLQLVAGCDHSAATCKAKFNNFDNFGGFVAVPDRNLSLQGLNTSVSAGNKK